MITFGEVFTFEHLYDCARECCNGVRWKASTQTFESAILIWVARLKRELEEGTYRSKGFTEFDIKERGKTRHIQSIHISERTVQKCLIQYGLRPLIMPKLIISNHATLPGHGTETAIKELREHLRWWHARHGHDGGILVMDYHDYFGSIRHDVLKGMYRKLDIDDRLYELTCYFIDCFDGNKGLGLGSEISQISAVFYVNRIDHIMKDELGFHCYSRYMDDSYAIGDIDDLGSALVRIAAASADLGLSFNPNITRIVKLKGNSFKYLKKRVFSSDTGRVVMRLDRANVRRERKRLKQNMAKLANREISFESEYQSWQSWKSYALKIDAYDTVDSVSKERDAALDLVRKSLSC